MYYIEKINKTLVDPIFPDRMVKVKTQKTSRKNDMRKLMETQLQFGQTDIASIELDLECRDEIPQVLAGLQFIYTNSSLKAAVFNILKQLMPKRVNTKTGRPGMDLWNILVLGVLRLNCNWNFDKLHDIANNHKTIRDFLGHGIYDFDKRYGLQTIKDNVRRLSVQAMDHISQLVVKAGHQMFRGSAKQGLKGRCDSFVVETNVHYPTDINLLLDAIRKVILSIGPLFNELGITQWRQYRNNFKKIKKQFTLVNRLKHSTSKDEIKKAQKAQLTVDAHRQYVDLVESYVQRAMDSMTIIKGMGLDQMQMARVMVIEKFIGDAKRQMNQIRRRVLEGETIAHHEKVFSIFQEHTEWISKGKAGVPQELGLAVCILEDEYGFILHHHVMEHQKDVDIAVDMVAQAKRKFVCLSACSFDKGFYSPSNRQDLQPILDQVVLPKKGRLSVVDKETEYSDEFIASRRKHAAVESAINALENHGLDRCPDYGLHGFKRYAALAILARNIQILGAILRKKELKRRQREQKRAA